LYPLQLYSLVSLLFSALQAKAGCPLRFTTTGLGSSIITFCIIKHPYRRYRNVVCPAARSGEQVLLFWGGSAAFGTSSNGKGVWRVIRWAQDDAVWNRSAPPLQDTSFCMVKATGVGVFLGKQVPCWRHILMPEVS